ncbi:MAG: 2,3-bisphosphoglycerate-independent phosphoglycerate mutase [Bacilli bacterium]
MKKVIFTILDGVGIREEEIGNAVKNASTKAIDKLLKEFPNSKLKASGEAVGLPKGQMGNSEVGHITIGSGRIINQPLQKINKALEDGSFYKNEEIKKAINHAKENNSKLHILGLLSDGGVHSHINHIFALIKMAKEAKIEKLYIHAFLDGRDVPYNSALKYLKALEEFLKKEQIGELATISGRYYAMDREKMWDKTKKCYDALVNKEAPIISSYETVLQANYQKGIYDEFIPPTIINEKGFIEDRDSIIVANFRPDRIPQLFEAIANEEFDHFKTKKLNNIKLLTMMPVSNTLKADTAFKHEIIKNTLGEVLSEEGYRVLRIAETSKYPHVTHFIDGDKDVNLKYTSKILVPRQDVPTYDLKPEMSAEEVTEKIKYLIDDYDFVIVNYANGDMVGHTGNYQSAIKAVEELDRCVRNLYELSFQKDILLIITADHGNCEEMIDEKGRPHTYHTTNKVPFIVCDKNYKVEDGELSDIAPSILNVLNIEIPKEMTGNIIIKENK